MQDLMRFEDVAELLELDARDEKRNRLFLSAVSEEICLYLDRNLLTGTTTEKQMTERCEFYPEQYPVREIIEIVDDTTGSSLQLTAESAIRDFQCPDAHGNRIYRIQGETDRMIRFTYRYGYELSELPALIKACLLDLIRDRLEALSGTDKDIPDSQSRLRDIDAYRKLNL
ncbi:hypothetical protein K7J14_02630 [Treponema zuelzerae]|uniref:Uncharacterized protein n=1 Tax=Teretinema zuelzerae TaxID=156 RepID=A0AAE3JK34_9SPIR|nr:hypothetical protein [Teretinema zuelzerae]MCD1653594.1 hypothetical protein [Teretinema zuelzerae]